MAAMVPAAVLPVLEDQRATGALRSLLMSALELMAKICVGKNVGTVAQSATGTDVRYSNRRALVLRAFLGSIP